ncbi:MAG: glycosyltransferase family 2 protein [Chloroflexota bacterium]
MTHISVIVPTYNRLDRLQRVLAALEKQTYPLDQFEVIVVSDGASDGTNEYLTTVTETGATPLNLRPVLQENQGVAVARNNGIKQASSPLVLFVDDDVVPEPQMVQEHVNWHETHGEGVIVLGPMLTPPDFEMKPWVLWEQKMLEKQYHAMLTGIFTPTARQFYTGNTSLARRYLVESGGFDPSFRRAEDVELAYRLHDMGLRFVFNYEAVGYHYAERSFASWIAIPYAYGRNDVIFTYDKGQSWLLPDVWEEFHGRNPLVKGLTKLCLDRQALSKTAVFLLKQASHVGNRFNQERLAAMAYSGIFNLRYYQGNSDELGGRHLFFAGVAGEQVQPKQMPMQAQMLAAD